MTTKPARKTVNWGKPRAAASRRGASRALMCGPRGVRRGFADHAAGGSVVPTRTNAEDRGVGSAGQHLLAKPPLAPEPGRKLLSECRVSLPGRHSPWAKASPNGADAFG